MIFKTTTNRFGETRLETNFGNIKNFFTRQNMLSDSDINAIKAYNEEFIRLSDKVQVSAVNVSNYTIAQKAANSTMQNASTAAQDMVAKANGNTVALGNLTKASKASEVALKGLAIAGNMALMWGISEAITLIHDCATASDRLKESASGLGSQFSSTKSDIESYKTKINDLYKIINDSSSSYEDTYNARQKLLTIQDELIEKFGSEAETVQLVTAAINEQTEALDSLTKKKWQETVNEFISGSDKKWTERVGDSWANLWSGTSNNFDRMINEMEDTEVSFRVIPRYDEDGTYEEFSKKLKETFGASITHTERDDVFTLSGDLDDIYNQMLNIQSLANNLGIDDSFLPDLTRQANEVKNTLESYQEIYDQHILYDKIFDSDVYEQSFKEINDAYQKYQDAFTSGNEEAIEKAKQSFAEIVQGATDGITDDSVVDFFTNMYPDLQAVVSGWLFEVRFKAAIEDNEDNFENDVKDAISKFSTSEEVLNFNYKTATDEQKTAYETLQSILQDNNMELDELIVKLEKLGLISSDAKKYLRDKLSNSGQDLVVDDWIDTLTEEEAKLANSTAFDKALERQKENLNGATLSAENYSAALEDVKVQQNEISADETPVSLSISETVDQLNTQLKPAIDSLNSAWNDIFTDDGFELNSIDILSTCDSIKSKLDEMKDLGLKIDYSSYEDFVRVLTNSESTTSDVDKAFDHLANSITHAAVSGTEDFETMQAVLSNLGIENSTMVAFDEFTSNTKLLEESVKQAGITMDEFVISTNDGKLVASEAANAFLEEIVGAENCAQALALLQLKQVLINQSTINTADDCQNILDLATAANIGIAYLEQLNTLMNLITQRDSAHARGDSRAVSELNRAIRDFSSNIVNNLKIDDIKVNWEGLGKGAKSAGGKAGKDYKDALKEQLSDLDSIISGITKSIDKQISSINEEKSAALDAIDAQIDALEEERDARLAVIEAQKKQLEEQIKLIDKQIKSKQDEIKAIEDAAKAKEHEIALQKAQYELERMQNQRTILQYSEDKGIHYVQDTKNIRDAKDEVDSAKRQLDIDAIEKEIDLLEEQKDLLNEQINLLDEQADAINEFFDAQIKGLEKQKEATEKYFESLIKSLENSKSKYEELLEIVDKAELSAKLKQLGIDEEALLNGSEEEFEKLKQAYLDIVYQLNAGNDDVLSKLMELSGYEGKAPAMLEDSNTELDTMNDELGNANEKVGNVNSSLGETASATSEVASNVGDITSNLTEANELVTEEQTAFNNLKQKIDEVIEAINIKTEAIEAEQEAVGIATSSEMADFLLLKDKILEVKETLESFGTQDEGLISNIASAIQSLNDISLDEGIIAQLTNLKEAIDAVTTAISGGESSGGDVSGSGSGSGKGGESGGKGSKGEGGNSNSLTGAIKQMGETAQEVIGEPDAEGDGTVIGEFGSMETAVNDVTEAIGGGDSESGKSSGGEDENNLIGSIVDLGETTEETLGEPGGNGVIGRFEKFKDVIGEADEHVQSINHGLDEIDGKEVECTVKVNIEVSGGQAFTGSAQVLGSMNLNSAEYNAKYAGNAHYEGTAEVTGDWGVREAGTTLVGELGQELVVRGSRFFTVGDNGAEFVNLQKGDIVFNHLQTRELLSKGNYVGRGRAVASGTALAHSTTTQSNPKYEPYDPDKDDSSFSKLYKAWNAYYGNIDKNVDEINKTLSQHLVIEHNQKMNKEVNQFVNSASNVVNNSKPNINVGGIHITCPGVTSQEVVKQVGVELNHMFNGLHLEAMQQSTRR